MIEGIRNGKIKPEELSGDFILQTYDRLNKAASLGYGKQYYGDEISSKIRENILHFSATKTAVQQSFTSELSKSTKDNKDYREQAKAYLNLQNDTYLDVQSAWASRKAQSARQYQDWQRDKDIYPNVKFRTMEDERVRESHAVLDGMIIPVDSPKMGMYMPPLGPRCRCWFEQTFDKADDKFPEYEPNPEWSGNTGETGVVFNEQNSYQVQITDKAVRENIRIQAEAAKEKVPYTYSFKSGNNKVRISDFADRKDYKANIAVANILASEIKKDIYIRPHVNIDGHKNPELAIGEENMRADLKTFTEESAIGNFVRNNVRKAGKQEAAIAVLDVTLFKGDEEEIERAISGAFGSGNKSIEEVITILGKQIKTYMRKKK